MKITLLAIAKTDNNYLLTGVNEYIERLKHYTKFEFIEIQSPSRHKSLNPEQLKEAEGKLILKYFDGVDVVLLLDEKGKSFTSIEFATWIQRQMNIGVRHLMFVIGGAFGFSTDVYKAAHGKVSLSAMTFSHQMIRLFFVEQIYRAFTILKNEPYHNQ